MKTSQENTQGGRPFVCDSCQQNGLNTLVVNLCRTTTNKWVQKSSHPAPRIRQHKGKANQTTKPPNQTKPNSNGGCWVDLHKEGQVSTTPIQQIWHQLKNAKSIHGHGQLDDHRPVFTRRVILVWSDVVVPSQQRAKTIRQDQVQAVQGSGSNKNPAVWSSKTNSLIQQNQ